MWFVGKKTKATEPDLSVVESRQLPTAHKIKIAKNIIRKFLNIDELSLLSHKRGIKKA